MKIEITPTNDIVDMGGFCARRWTGTTEKGARVELFVSRIASHVDEDRTELEAELLELHDCMVTPLKNLLRRLHQERRLHAGFTKSKTTEAFANIEKERDVENPDDQDH